MTLLAVHPRIMRVGATAKAAAADTYRQLNLFGDVFERVRADYVEKPDDAKLIETAINRMLTYHTRKERRSERYHANLARAPDPTRVSAWTYTLKPGQVAFVEQAVGSLMTRYGYEPVATYSAHWIRNAGFRAAVERFLAQERSEMACEMAQLRELLPYRQGLLGG